jgi:hypothetical protein
VEVPRIVLVLYNTGWSPSAVALRAAPAPGRAGR